MYLLDTDHMSVLRYGGAAAFRLEQRLGAVPDEEIVTCIVVYEEQMRGWMATMARMQSGPQFTQPYNSLATNLSIYCAMTLLPFDDRAAACYDELKRLKIRIGTQDLKIASISLANDTILLTRNTRDFVHVPGLKFEDWTR